MVLLKASCAIGSEVPDAYHSGTVYREVTDSAGRVLFEGALKVVKRSPVIALGH